MKIRFTVAALIGVVFLSAAQARDAAPLGPSATAAAMDKQIDWSRASMIAVQQGNRYKTLESFSREAIAAMYGKEHFPGLTPIASAMEWLFNAQAYMDIPVVRVKEAGLRVHLSAHMPDAARQRITQTGFMTPRELFDPVVLQRLDELEPRFDTNRAVGRVRTAEIFCKQMPRFMQIVPTNSADPSAMWLTPEEIRANAAIALLIEQSRDRKGADPANLDMQQVEQIARQFGTPAMNFKNPDAAAVIVGAWQQLSEGWKARDVQKVQASLDRLCEVLPAQAQPGVYPGEAQRRGETNYYKFGKFAWGYWLYLFGTVIGVLAYVTRWRIPWWITVALLVAGLGVHTYGVVLRWQIVDRIPNANMFEAVTFASWGAILLGLVLALWYRSPLFLIASHFTGFMTLVVAHFGIQGGGNITPIMGILDDIMLRIHTTVITISYVLVFLAGVLGTIYLYGYYLIRNPGRSIETAALFALGGALLVLATGSGLHGALYSIDPATSLPQLRAGLAPVLWGACGAALLVLILTPLLTRRVVPTFLFSALVLATVFGVTAGLPHWAVSATGWSLLVIGLAWALATGAGLGVLRWLEARPRTGAATQTMAHGFGMPHLAAAGVPGEAFRGVSDLSERSAAAPQLTSPLAARPILAGAAPGDERERLPQWLIDCDWMHLIVLNLIFVLLFVGTILGAVWADYSWGRPWGWDPKEVFAMNTWIVYVILIHIRFVVKKRGLWTAWLSVAGTAMMAFNWWVVNHYIVGLHSYA